MDYNEKHAITPASIQKAVRENLETLKVAEEDSQYSLTQSIEQLNEADMLELMNKLEKEMKEAARDLQFERAASLRDKLLEVKRMMK